MNGPECSIEGCNRKSRKKQRRGKIYFESLCNRHTEEKYRPGRKRPGRDNKRERKIRQFGDATLCVLCGWCGPCDFHRVIPGCRGGGYDDGNVVIVCPNCHRLLHRGMLVID